MLHSLSIPTEFLSAKEHFKPQSSPFSTTLLLQSEFWRLSVLIYLPISNSTPEPDPLTMAAQPSQSQLPYQGISSHLPAGTLLGIACFSVDLTGAFVIARTRMCLTRNRWLSKFKLYSVYSHPITLAPHSRYYRAGSTYHGRSTLGLITTIPGLLISSPRRRSYRYCLVQRRPRGCVRYGSYTHTSYPHR